MKGFWKNCLASATLTLLFCGISIFSLEKVFADGVTEEETASFVCTYWQDPPPFGAHNCIDQSTLFDCAGVKSCKFTKGLLPSSNTCFCQ